MSKCTIFFKIRGSKLHRSG